MELSNTSSSSGKNVGVHHKSNVDREWIHVVEVRFNVVSNKGTLIDRDKTYHFFNAQQLFVSCPLNISTEGKGVFCFFSDAVARIENKIIYVEESINQNLYT